MSNSLYPGFVRIHYESNGHPHKMVIPVTPVSGTGGTDDFGLELKGGGTATDWALAVSNFVEGQLDLFLHTSDTFGSAELWTMSSPTADPINVSVTDLSNTGASTGAVLALGMMNMTWRTQAGGIYRLVVMEPAGLALNDEQFPPYTAQLLDMDTFLRGTTSFVHGRDGGFLSAPIRYLTKTNDALRKKYLLDQ
jgi:hypothetical protein